MYISPDLEDTLHTVNVKLSEESTKAIQIDYIRVFHNKISPSKIKINSEDLYLYPDQNVELTVSFEPWVVKIKI